MTLTPLHPSLTFPLWGKRGQSEPLKEENTKRRGGGGAVQPHRASGTTSGSRPLLEDSQDRGVQSERPVLVRLATRVRIVRHERKPPLPPFSAAALSVNMKCWKRRRRQRLFAVLDIWHSCPTQRRHVPAEPGHSAKHIHRLWQSVTDIWAQTAGNLHLHRKLANN